MLQDRQFNADGSLDFDVGQSFGLETGRLGNTMLVNGTVKPHLDVGAQRIRFRLLNGSDARIYNVGFTDNRAFDLVATDEGLLDHPVALHRIQLAPGERAEIVVMFRNADTATLHSFPPNLHLESLQNGGGFGGGGGGGRGDGGGGGGGGGGGAGGGIDFERTLNGGGQSLDLMRISASARLRSSPPVPQQLVPLAPIDTGTAVRTRQFELDRTNAINNQQMDMNRVDFSVAAGSTEIWEVSGFLPHDFHIHGVSFRVIDVGGKPPAPQEGGWKDTVYVPPGQTVRLLVQFGDYADPNHPYMYHCHMLQHEDAGMMGQFVVVRSGQQA